MVKKRFVGTSLVINEEHGNEPIHSNSGVQDRVV